MRLIPGRDWQPSYINDDGKQMWYSSDRPETEREVLEDRYLRELSQRQELKLTQEFLDTIKQG